MSRIVPAEEFALIEQVVSGLKKVLALHLPKALNRHYLSFI